MNNNNCDEKEEDENEKICDLFFKEILSKERIPHLISLTICNFPKSKSFKDFLSHFLNAFIFNAVIDFRIINKKLFFFSNNIMFFISTYDLTQKEDQLFMKIQQHPHLFFNSPFDSRTHFSSFKYNHIIKIDGAQMLLDFINISLSSIYSLASSSDNISYYVEYKKCIQEMLSLLSETNIYYNNKYNDILAPSISRLSYLFSLPQSSTSPYSSQK